MSPTCYSIVVYAALFGQVMDSDDAADRQRGIRAAVRRLSADDFATREQAYRELWRYGLAAEAALRTAANSRDAEMRGRARRLLHDFEYGILPVTEVETRQLIREFRDGPHGARQAAFQHLVQQERIEILERLIRLEADPQIRRLLLVQLFQSPQVVDRFVQPDRLDALIAAIGADQDASWRRSVTIQLTFAPNMLSRLAETGSLNQLLQLIRDEADVPARRAMLAAIFRTPAVGVVLARNELDFALGALRTVPDQKFRGELLGEIFSNAQAAQAVVAHQQLDKLLSFSRQQTDAASQQKLIERILACGPVVESLLKAGGIERVVALAAEEPDPVRRGRLLGAALASTAVRNFLQRIGLTQLAIKLAKEEANPAARHEFLQALLHDTSFVYSLNDEAAIAELWALIKADENADWRAQALIVLLRSHRSNALLKDEQEAAWILELAADETSGPIREDILRFLLPNVNAQRVLIAGGHFDTMLSLARSLPIRSRGEILASFLAGSGVAEHLVAANRTELLIDVAKSEPDAAARQLCLQGIFRNSMAMTALLEADHYTTFRDLIHQDTDAARRASLFGTFVQNYRVMEELTKRGDSPLLLSFAESDDEGARRQFLPRLFRNHRAVELLMDQGHFERLVDLARQDGGTNLDELLAVPRVIEHLAATEQFGLFFDFAASQADDNTRRSLLRNVFIYPATVDALIASNNFERLLHIIHAERDPTWRATLLGAVVASPAVVTHFASSNKLDTLLAMISDEPELVVRARLMTYLTSRTETLNILIEQGRLDSLIALARQHSAGRTRGSLLARIVTNDKALERFKADQRVGLLLSFTGDVDREFTAAYSASLFNNSHAIDLLVEHGYYSDLFKIATAGRDTKAQAVLIGQLLSNRNVIEQLIARGELATLATIDANVKRSVLHTVWQNDKLRNALLQTDQFETFCESIQSIPDAQWQASMLGMAFSSPEVVRRYVETKTVDRFFALLEQQMPRSAREQILSAVLRRSEVVDPLVEHGFGVRLSELAGRELPSRE